MRRAPVVLALIVAAALGTPDASARIGPVPVLRLPGTQSRAFRNATYLTFTSNSRADPAHDDAFAWRIGTGAQVRLNADGTEGWSGGFDPRTDTAVYQEIASPTDSDLYLYDLDTDTRTAVAGVDTGAWEWSPRISHTYISFLRYTFGHGSRHTGVYLYDRANDRTRWVTGYAGYRFMDNGSVGNRYATWTVCGPHTCTAYVYDATATSLRKVPTSGRAPQYAPVVDETNGRLFFVRGGFGCGRHVTFYRLPVRHLRATPVAIATLPAGIDTNDVVSLWREGATGRTDLLFSRAACRAKGRADVFALPGVTTG
jgi:hypothetical protein